LININYPTENSVKRLDNCITSIYQRNLLFKHHGRGILIVSLMFISLLGIVQHAEASSAFNEGYDDGKDDYLNGGEKNSYCDPYNSAPNPDAYCATYKIRYEAGWAAARGLYGDQ
jgi:hypothetical protein